MLEFNEELHQYTDNGIVIPSVTQILQFSGLTPDFSMVKPADLEWKANLGTQVHAATALDDEDNLGGYDTQINGYIEAWRRFKAECDFVPQVAEQRVYSKKYGYAGTLDRIGKLGGVDTLLDIKTASIVDLICVGPQTAAYEAASNEQNKRKTKYKRYAVKLSPDGKYKLIACSNQMDLQVFLSALNLYNWRMSKHDRG
ncbi:MAG: hypothetical protein H6Q72_921 [Firmicutes bacterium]|nr:hypothetical protein [Bacillota bacterium]